MEKSNLLGIAVVLGITGCGAAGEGSSATADDGSTSGEGTTESGPTGDEGEVDPSMVSTAGSTTAPSGSSGSSDAGESDPDTGSTSGETETGIPVFVALGDGGWTATSCDRGRSWSVQAFSDERGDHTPWTAFGGVAHGAGGFVAGFGWGAPGHLLHSPDGRTWTDLPARAFLDGGDVVGYGSHTAGVVHDGAGFIAFGSSMWRSADGATWNAEPGTLPPGAEQLRQVRGFGDEGLVVAAVESQSGNQHPAGNFVVVSEDGGASWTEGTGYDPACGNPIQHSGDIEMRGDVVLVATGTLCRSPDRGATWTAFADPVSGDIRDLGRTDDAFLAVTGDRVFRSETGESWTELGQIGIEARAVAHDDGVFAAVGTMGTNFAYSDDGAVWSPAEVEGATGEVWVRDLAVGMVDTPCE